MGEAKKMNVTKDWYIQNLYKSQVYVAQSFWVICLNISRTIVELCMKTPYLCTVLAAGNQKKHLEFTFSIKDLSFHSRASIRAHKHIFSYLKWLNCWKSRGEGFFNEKAFLFCVEIRERKGFSKKFLFSALRASLCSKKRGWGRGRPPWAPPLGPSPGSATGTSLRSWRDSGRRVRYVVSWINGSPFALPRKKPRAQQSRQLRRLTATSPIKGGKLVAKLMHSTGFDLWTYHFSHMGKNIVLSLIG